MPDKDELPDTQRLMLEVTNLQAALKKVQVGMEIHRAEIRMQSAIVRAVCKLLPSDKKEAARELIERWAQLEPKYVEDEEEKERARFGITRIASEWFVDLQN